MVPIGWLSFVHGEQVQKGEEEGKVHQVLIDFPMGGKQKAILEVFLILPIFKIICKTKQSQMISFCTLLVLKSLGGTVWVFSLCSGVPTFQAACLCRTGDRS